jgi:hypothetical protein
MNVIRQLRPVLPGGASSFPTLAATATTAIGSNTTSHVVNLPAGIANGDLLLMWFRTGNTTTPHTAPSGWTEFQTNSVTSGRTTLFWRVSDGSDGSTATVTSTNARRSAAIVMRITGQAASSPIQAGAFSSSYDPDSLTASGGSAKYLWLAMCSSRQTIDITAAPTNFTGLVVASSTTLGGTNVLEVVMAIASRQFETATQDPDAFTAASNNIPMSLCVLIKPL